MNTHFGTNWCNYHFALSSVLFSVVQPLPASILEHPWWGKISFRNFPCFKPHLQIVSQIFGYSFWELLRAVWMPNARLLWCKWKDSIKDNLRKEDSYQVKHQCQTRCHRWDPKRSLLFWCYFSSSPLSISFIFIFVRL